MPSVQIKGVPEGTHAILRRRAAEAHQSLQEYLLELLNREASLPPVDEIWDRIGRRSGGAVSFDDSVRDLRDDRDRR
jgi:hypothetical protein